jgi:hypothetical protein
MRRGRQSPRLVCIRMTPRARAALAQAPWPDFYPWLGKLQGCGVWWELPGDFPGHRVWRAFPPRSYERQVIGVCQRVTDRRWCWVLRD